MMPRLSVALVTYNEEANLARTLGSVTSLFRHLPGEIVVVDSHSTDRTVEIALSFNAKVTTRDWPGFAAQKNFAIAQCAGEWILSLDADEELSPELQQELQNLFAAQSTAQAFYLNRRNLFLGRWISHGGFYPDAKLRLFHSNISSIPQFAERPVHEVIHFNGPTGTLTKDLIHHAYPTLSDYIEHMDRYSTLGAKLLVTQGRTSRSSLAFIAMTALIPALTFVKNYIFRLGFLDGREGFLLHLYHAVYTSWKYAKAWEKQRVE